MLFCFPTDFKLMVLKGVQTHDEVRIKLIEWYSMTAEKEIYILSQDCIELEKYV